MEEFAACGDDTGETDDTTQVLIDHVSILFIGRIDDTTQVLIDHI
jgi:hypothetical protein